MPWRSPLEANPSRAPEKDSQIPPQLTPSGTDVPEKPLKVTETTKRGTSMEHVNSTETGPGSARGVMDRMRDSATAQLASQKDRATTSLDSLAQAVRQTTQPLRDNKQDAIAQYVEEAADRLDRFTTRLRERNVSDLVQEVQHFARRQPAVFVGAAFAVGVIAARFLKSSADARRGYSTGGF